MADLENQISIAELLNYLAYQAAGNNIYSCCRPPLPVWVTSCLKKAKCLQDGNLLAAPSDEKIEKVIERLFHDTASISAPTLKQSLWSITYLLAGIS